MSIVKYTYANQIEAQKLFTTAQIYAVFSIHALDHTDHTGHTHLQYNRTHHITIQCCKEPLTHGPEQYRVQTPASAFTTVSSPSEALSLLLA